MPLISIGLLQQQKAASAGFGTFPSVAGISKGTTYGDTFRRTTLNPSNNLQMYSTAIAGAGTVAISNNREVTCTTGTTIGNDAGFFPSELGYTNSYRGPAYDNLRFQFDLTFSISTVASMEFFVGIITVADLTALPTTTRHIGAFLDSSVSGNVILSSADGTTQSTTDSGDAAQTNDNYRLRILWDGDEVGSVSLFGGGDASTLNTQLGSTHDVTSLLGSEVVFALIPYFFVQTETTLGRILVAHSWKVDVFTA